MFPLTTDVNPDGEVISDFIIKHLIIKKKKILKYFSSLRIYEYD